MMPRYSYKVAAWEKNPHWEPLDEPEPDYWMETIVQIYEWGALIETRYYGEFQSLSGKYGLSRVELYEPPQRHVARSLR